MKKGDIVTIIVDEMIESWGFNSSDVHSILWVDETDPDNIYYGILGPDGVMCEFLESELILVAASGGNTLVSRRETQYNEI